MIRKYLQKIYLTLIFILLYAPIVTLVVLSFNQSKTRAKWGGFTLKWYKELFQNEQIMSAFYTTLIIAFISAAVATLIGTAAAIAIQGMKQKWKTMYMGLTNIPVSYTHLDVYKRQGTYPLSECRQFCANAG